MLSLLLSFEKMKLFASMECLSILTYNGSEWMKEFVEICQNYGIMHRFIALAWPQYNGMVECLIKTIKHGFTIMVATNVQNWDSLLP